MRPWEEIITEAKSKKEKELEDRVSQLDDVPSSLKKEKAKKENKKKKSDYTKYLEKQLKYKQQKYEDQKKRQLEKSKEREEESIKRASKKSFARSSRALSGINIRKVGEKESSVTGVKKSAETAGSIAKGLTGAAIHGIAGLIRKRKAKKEAERKREESLASQAEKKEPKKPGRPKKKRDVKSSSPDISEKPSTGPGRLLSGGPSSGPRRLPPAGPPDGPSSGPRRLPPSGPRRLPAGKESLAQRARRDPKFKEREIKKRQTPINNEFFSDWKSDFLTESGLILEVGKTDKEKKQKIISVMRGKNKIKINPDISEGHKDISSGKEKDNEGYMTRIELDSMERAINALRKKVKKSDIQLPAWVQSKITRAADYIDTASEYMQSDENLDEENINEIAPIVAALGRVALGAGARTAATAAARKTAGKMIKDKAKEIAVDKVKEKMKQKFSGNTNETGSGENPIDSAVKGVNRLFKIGESAWSVSDSEVEISEAKKSEMKCNKPKAEAHGSGESGKSHVVKACEGGKEKLIRFGQLGVKGSPKKEGESEEYANRRKRFKTRHAKNIAKGKMSAAFWSNKVKW